MREVVQGIYVACSHFAWQEVLIVLILFAESTRIMSEQCMWRMPGYKFEGFLCRAFCHMFCKGLKKS